LSRFHQGLLRSYIGLQCNSMSDAADFDDVKDPDSQSTHACCLLFALLTTLRDRRQSVRQHPGTPIIASHHPCRKNIGPTFCALYQRISLAKGENFNSKYVHFLPQIRTPGKNLAIQNLSHYLIVSIQLTIHYAINSRPSFTSAGPLALRPTYPRGP